MSPAAPPPLDLALVVEDPRWEGLVAGGDAGLDRLAADAVRAAVAGAGEDDAALSLAVVLADDARVTALNKAYRGKDGPTNVLSFAARDLGLPTPPPEAGEAEALGDIILALETCRREADGQGIAVADHLCHLIVHGVLHLLGYDHIDDQDAEDMERLETEVLAGLGVADPYAGDVPDTSPSSPMDER